MWIQIRLLIEEQSDLGLHSLSNRLLKHFSGQNFAVIGALTLWLLGIFSCFLSSADLFKINFFK